MIHFCLFWGYNFAVSPNTLWNYHREENQKHSDIILRKHQFCKLLRLEDMVPFFDVLHWISLGQQEKWLSDWRHAWGLGWGMPGSPDEKGRNVDGRKAQLIKTSELSWHFPGHCEIQTFSTTGLPVLQDFWLFLFPVLTSLITARGIGTETCKVWNTLCKG